MRRVSHALAALTAPPGATEGTRRSLFVHVPKAAGTSVTALLAGLVPAGRTTPFHAASDPERRWPGLDGFPDAFSLFAGHVDVATATSMIGPAPVLVVLRDPVRRLTSLYHFLRSLPIDDDLPPVALDRRRTAHRLSLLEWATEGLERTRCYTTDAQVRFLGGKVDRPKLSALAVLESTAWVALVEDLDDGLGDLAAALGLPPVLGSCLPGWNTGPKVDVEVTDEVRALLREGNPHDAVLYQRASELIARRRAARSDGAADPPEDLTDLDDAPVRWSAAEGTLWGPGWHRAEPGSSSCWTGAAPAAGLVVDAPPGLRVEVRIAVDAARPGAVESAAIEVDGRPAALEVESRGRKRQLVAVAELDRRRRHLVALRSSREQPPIAADGRQDPRELGLSVSTVELVPLR